MQFSSRNNLMFIPAEAMLHILFMRINFARGEDFYFSSTTAKMKISEMKIAQDYIFIWVKDLHCLEQ